MHAESDIRADRGNTRFANIEGFYPGTDVKCPKTWMREMRGIKD